MEPALARGHHDRLAVVGVEQDPVGQSLDSLREALDLAVEGLLDPGAKRNSATSFVEYFWISCWGEPSATIVPCP